MERTARVVKPLAAALAVGAAAGALLVLARSPSYGFLPNAQRVTLHEQTTDGVHTVLARFVASEPAPRILERLRNESPMRLERETAINGRRGWVVTIPRNDGERADLSFPPAREVTIVEGSSASVEVREYRATGALDALVEWVRSPLRA